MVNSIFKIIKLFPCTFGVYGRPFFQFLCYILRMQKCLQGIVRGGPVREQQQSAVPRLIPRPNKTASQYSRTQLHCVHSHTESSH